MKKNNLILILSLIGFFISLFLYMSSPNPNFCTLGGVCKTVLTSKYSQTFGINNSLLGMIYFSFIIILNYFNKEKIVKLLSIFSALFALYLIYIMFFVLKEICYYCLIVDFSAIIIAILNFSNFRWIR